MRSEEQWATTMLMRVADMSVPAGKETVLGGPRNAGTPRRRQDPTIGDRTSDRRVGLLASGLSRELKQHTRLMAPRFGSSPPQRQHTRPSAIAPGAR